MAKSDRDSATNSWLGYASCFGLGLAYGSGSTAVFGLVIAAAVQWTVLLGLAELCSAFPSSGVSLLFLHARASLTGQGQYHFTYILAPRPLRSFAAYIVGMINIISWWVTTASGTFLTAISAFGIAKFWHPDFVGAQWQVYLCYVLVIIMTCKPRKAKPPSKADEISGSYFHRPTSTYRLPDKDMYASLRCRICPGSGRLARHGTWHVSSQQPSRLSKHQRLGGWSGLDDEHWNWGICLRSSWSMYTHCRRDTSPESTSTACHVCKCQSIHVFLLLIR